MAFTIIEITDFKISIRKYPIICHFARMVDPIPIREYSNTVILIINNYTPTTSLAITAITGYLFITIVIIIIVITYF